MELYLDNAATTQIDKDVLEQYIQLISSQFASTGSLHSLGENSLNLENLSRIKIANLLKVRPNEILFNSGATEGNNFAIKGVALKYKNRGKTLITTKVEHPSVAQCFKQLEQDFGFKCIYLDVDSNGVVDINQLEKSMSDDVILVSIMYVNHEVGSIMPITKIGQILKKYPKAIFHTDITQALGKINIDLTNVDIATMSAHKIHGIKGSGFIYKKEKIEFYPLISGHPAANALRAGTSNWPSNVVLSLALEKTLKNLKASFNEIRRSQEKLINELASIDNVVLNTSIDKCIPNIINFSIIGYNSEVVIRALSLKNIFVSSRSVCSTSKDEQISVTLSAMNKPDEVSISSIRISFDKPLDDDQIKYFIDSLKEVIKVLRK